MKPHEEEWELEATGRPGDVHLTTNGKALEWTKERAMLVRAAPDMARELVRRVNACEACRGTGRTSVRSLHGRSEEACPSCEDARAALAKGGVPCP